MGKTVYKDIGMELVEMRGWWQTRMSRMNVALNRRNVL